MIPISLTVQNCHTGAIAFEHPSHEDYTERFTNRERVLLEGGFRVFHDPLVYSLLIMRNTRPI